MEVRLVPGLDPKDVLEKIKQQLKKNGYDQVELVYTLGEMSYRSDTSAPSILNVIRLAKDFYREGVSVLPTTAGQGPCIRYLRLCRYRWQPLELAMPTAVIMGATKM